MNHSTMRYGGMATAAEQNALREQGIYNGLTARQKQAGLAGQLDLNQMADQAIHYTLKYGNPELSKMASFSEQSNAPVHPEMPFGYDMRASAVNNQVRNEMTAQQMHNALSLQQTHNELATKQLQTALTMQAGREDTNAMQVQEALKREEFKNDQNFENLKQFQSYKEAFTTSEQKQEEKSSFSEGSEYKFTHLSAPSKVENYNNVFSNSKTFVIEPQHNKTVYVNLISTTRYYHPQFRIYEKKDGKFYLMQNVNFNNKFFLASKGFYVVEIGTDNNIDTEPFPKMKYGSYEMIISSEIRTISETLNDEGIRVQIWGFEGTVPFTQSSEITLYHDSWKYISFGILNYQITPFYDADYRTLTIYFHRGSTQYTGKKMRATTIEVKCNRNLFTQKTYFGTEPRPARYHFDVQSRRICDLINLIE